MKCPVCDRECTVTEIVCVTGTTKSVETQERCECGYKDSYENHEFYKEGLSQCKCEMCETKITPKVIETEEALEVEMYCDNCGMYTHTYYWKEKEE